MGTRQKLMTVLMIELEKYSQPVAPSGAVDWGSLINNDDADDFGIPQPISAAADAAILSKPKAPPVSAAVAPLPPEVIAADKARREAASVALVAVDDQPVAVAMEEEETIVAAPPPAAMADPKKQRVDNPPIDVSESSAEDDAQEMQANLFRKLGDEACSRKDHIAAEKWFLQALNATPSSKPLMTRLAQCALSISPPDHGRALRHLRALVALPPPHGDAHLKAAKSCVAIGEVEEAIEHYDAALLEESASEAMVKEYLEKPSTPSESLAAAAKSSLSEVAKRAADGRVEAVYVLGQIKKAKLLGAEGRVIQACQAARSVRQACDFSPLGTELALVALEGSGKLSDALKEAKSAVERMPSDPVCKVLYCRLLARKGAAAQAEEELAKLVETPEPEGGRPEWQQPGYMRACKALSGLRAAKSRKDEGNTAYGAGQYERAVTAYTAGLDEDVEGCLVPTLLGNRSQAYTKLGELQNALKDTERALLIDDDAIKMRLRRANCRLELNQPDEAVIDYEIILERDPENAQAVAGLERAEEIASGGDGRKGGLIDFEGERLDPYEVLNLNKDANAVQIKASFRKLALLWHPDKHEGETDEEKAYAVKQFKRIRIAHAVLSDPNERSRLDEEGEIVKGKGDEGREPFHEYYSINTPEGYTRGGCFVSTRRYDPMVGAVDARGSLNAGEKMSAAD